MNLRPRPRREGDGLIDGAEYVLTREDFRTIARIMREEAGIALPESKATLVYSRLAKRLRTLGLGSFAEYCELVESQQGGAERQEMLGALTTNVTRFFREPHHFEHLRSRILPPLMAHARSGGRVRLWSAACSSGQEPYSIALAVLALLPEAPRFDIRILATDIDRTMLATGRAGLYEASEIAAVPPELRERWFEPANNNSPKFRIAEAARSLVAFRPLNLIGTWPMRGRFNAIFCRNVVIYFDDETQKQVWARMVPLLEEGGALYIGHSERVSGPAERALGNDGITTYRLAGAREMRG